jgi:hypothetical protein
VDTRRSCRRLAPLGAAMQRIRSLRSRIRCAAPDDDLASLGHDSTSLRSALPCRG